MFEQGDEEAGNFAAQLTTALLIAGEDADLHGTTMQSSRNGSPLRLFIRVPNGPAPPAHGEQLLSALNIAHLPWEPGIAMGNPPGLVTITVATKQLPPD